MSRTARFRRPLLAALADGHFVRIRAGEGPHRFIPIWVVVVGGRVFVRSWTMKPGGWWRAFLDEPHGAIEIDARNVRVRARPVKGERLTAAIDRAYLEKYNTRGSLKYARGLGRGRRRRTTTELLPLGTAGRARRRART
jgi:hypothetical protein